MTTCHRRSSKCRACSGEAVTSFSDPRFRKPQNVAELGRRLETGSSRSRLVFASCRVSSLNIFTCVLTCEWIEETVDSKKTGALRTLGHGRTLITTSWCSRTWPCCTKFADDSPKLDETDKVAEVPLRVRADYAGSRAGAHQNGQFFTPRAGISDNLQIINCDDIAMNYVVSHLTRRPPFSIVGKTEFLFVKVLPLSLT